MNKKKQFKRNHTPLLPGILLALTLCLVMMAQNPPPTPPAIVFVSIPITAPLQSSDAPAGLHPSRHYQHQSQIHRIESIQPGKASALTADFFAACDPAVSFDGKKILFAGKQTKTTSWQIWQMDADGKNKVQITHHKTPSVSPLYIGSLFHLNDKSPSRKIAYVSGNQIYTSDLNGQHPQRITFSPTPSTAPDVLPNGRLVYSNNNNLMAINIDGTDLMGYLTHKDLPGKKNMVRFAQNERVYFIRTSQENKSDTYNGGALAYIKIRRPQHSYKLLAPATKGLYHSPCPLPGNALAVSYRTKKPGSLYRLVQLNDTTGKITKTIYNSQEYHCIDAQSLTPHPVVKGRSSFVEHKLDTGVFYCVSVYISQDPKLSKLPHGTIKQVRVLEGNVTEDNPEVKPRILGTAPVETDGSFHIRVPAKTLLAFQLLDNAGKVIATHKTWTWLMPRESHGCIGCHENRELSPPNRLPQAIIKPAVQLPVPKPTNKKGTLKK
ncbi:MAG: hypothetical protein GY757_51705 [bacterium]|nr:hypothetical protein [bacterium]